MKKQTIDKVADLRKANPKMPAVEIAAKLGVSKELVRQYLVKLGLPTRVERGGIRKKMTANYISHISCELLVVSDLINRGFSVFRAINPCAACDLIMMRKGVVVLVKVSTGAVGVGDYDVLATVTPFGEITYKPEITAL